MEPITRTNRTRNWTRRRINEELKARGIKQADLVRQTGRSKAMVSEVVAGLRKSRPVAVVIAGVLGLHPHEIWPRLYAPTTVAVAPTEEPTPEPTPEPIPYAS
jgi:lambda repressor-like predicted transcriptional regulator